MTLAAALVLPTRRDESWRYADLDAVARVWPVAAPEAIVIAAGQTETRHLIQSAADGAVAIHQFAVTIEAGARLDFHVLNTGGAYGRVSLDVTLRDGAIALDRSEWADLGWMANHIGPSPRALDAMRAAVDEAFTRITYLLDRELAPAYRVRAFLRAAEVVAQLAAY